MYSNVLPVFTPRVCYEHIGVWNFENNNEFMEITCRPVLNVDFNFQDAYSEIQAAQCTPSTRNLSVHILRSRIEYWKYGRNMSPSFRYYLTVENGAERGEKKHWFFFAILPSKYTICTMYACYWLQRDSSCKWEIRTKTCGPLLASIFGLTALRV